MHVTLGAPVLGGPGRVAGACTRRRNPEAALPRLAAVIRWIVRGTYTFTDEGPSIDEVDRIAVGEVRHAGGGARHAVGSGPWKTELEWGFETIERAREAELALKSVRVLHHVHAKALERILKPEEFQISHADARAGGARCVHCGARIPMDHGNEFALEGAGVGNEIFLRCGACDFVMGWQVVAE